MRTKVYSLAGLTANTTSVAAAQAPAAGTALTLTSSPVVFGSQKTFSGFGGRAMNPAPGTPMELFFTLLAGSTAQTFTIVGKDRWGQPLTATLVTAGGAQTLTTGQVWSEVDSITPSATDAGHNVSIGTPQRVTTPWVQLNQTRGVDQGNISYWSVDGLVSTPTFTLEGTAASLNEQGLGPQGWNNNSYNLPTYTGDNAPIDSTSTPASFPVQVTPGTQWTRLVITSATGSSAIARCVRPSF